MTKGQQSPTFIRKGAFINNMTVWAASCAAGVFVGLRYNAPDLGGPSGGDSRRRSGKWASLTLAAAGPLDITHAMELRSECG